MKATDIIKHAVKMYFEYASLAYPYRDVVEELYTTSDTKKQISE